MVEDLNAIKNTLQQLDIRSSESNLTKLLGCIQMLDKLIKEASDVQHQAE